MRSLIVTSSYPRNSDDPSGIFVKRLAVALERKGVSVIVLAPGDKDCRGEAWESGIKVVRFGYGPKFLMKIAYGHGGIPENLKHRPFLFLLLPFFLFSMLLYVLKLSGECDLIHANWLHCGLMCIPAKLLRRKPLVVTVRGSDLRNGGSMILSILTRMATAITVVSRAWQGEMSKKMNRRVFHTPNGVEASEDGLDVRRRFKFEESSIVALYIGSLQKRKGADLLPEIAKRTCLRNSSVRFLVVGPGDPGRFGLDKVPNLTYAGAAPPVEALRFYPNCDIFLLPSRFEGRPNALMEAMASGLAVVATRIAGVAELVDEDTGILVSVDDVSSMVDGICRLAEDAALRKWLGCKAKAKINDLSLDWRSSAESYLRVYEEVCRCAA